jgi:PAS domain S-box-containing protein
MSRSPLPSFARAIDLALLLHDTDSDAIVDANPAAEELYGYDIDCLRRLSIGDISTDRYPPETAHENIQAAADGDIQQFEWQIRRANNEIRWVEVALRPIELAGERFVFAEIQDVTEFKTRTRRLELLHRIIRHNLRNEMTVVRGHASSLEEALESDDRERQAEIIKQVADDVSGLTDSVSQIQEIAGNDSTDFTRRNLRDLVTELVTEFETDHPEAAIGVDCEEGVWVSVDQGLWYGLEHALENAVGHSDRDDPEILVTTTTEQDPDRAIVRIVDDGPRIPQMEVDAVTAQDAETSELSHGSGVGLFVMKWCAESLGGRIDIYENEPRGNVVEFSLPRLVDTVAA